MPVSLILATMSRTYIHGLESFRYVGPAESPQAIDAADQWVGTFAGACRRAATDASAFEARCDDIQRVWRERLGAVRAGSSVDVLLRLLAGSPVISVKSAMALTGRSKPSVNGAVARLVEAHVLHKVSVGRRNRGFEAREIIEEFARFERQMASPDGDTRTAPPARPVPDRPQLDQ